jgi:hypothetical protein
VGGLAKKAKKGRGEAEASRESTETGENDEDEPRCIPMMRSIARKGRKKVGLTLCALKQQRPRLKKAAGSTGRAYVSGMRSS